MYIFLFIMSMLIPFTMIGIGRTWRTNPPKDIGWSHGYRTAMSMKNQETWDFAQKFIAVIWFWCGIISSIISAILLIAFKNSDNFENMVIALVMVQLILLCLGILPTEVALKRHFDEDGNPRNE